MAFARAWRLAPRSQQPAFQQQPDWAIWRAPLMPQLQGLAHAYAISASATERMVAGEMLLALALQGEPVTDWWAQDAACTAFCNPYW